MFEALSLLSGVPLGIALFNCATWRRPGVPREGLGTMSVLIPARNEAQRIEQVIVGVLGSRAAAGESIVMEVIVYDDESEDETAEIVLRLASEDSRVRLLRGGPLPPGWIGKPHACQKLLEAARSDALIFVDADVELEALGLGRLISALEPGIDLVSAVPRQVTRTLAERAIVSLLLLTYVSWLPLNWVETQRSPRLVAANGQLLAFRRASLERLGGFGAVRGAIVDDVAIAKHAKRSGQRVRFVDGTRVASCRMYRSAAEVWEGFSKNLAPGLGGSFFGVFGVTSLYAVCFVLPYATLAFGLLTRDSSAIAAGGIGVVFNVLLRTVLSVRYHQDRAQIIFHPFAVLGLIVIAWNSWSWVRRRRIVWSGRTYAETQG